MLDRLFKIGNNRSSFHNGIENIKYILTKNAYPPFVIDKVIKKCFTYKFSSNKNQVKDTLDPHYFKLLYIDNLSYHIENELSNLCLVGTQYLMISNLS